MATPAAPASAPWDDAAAAAAQGRATALAMDLLAAGQVLPGDWNSLSEALRDHLRAWLPLLQASQWAVALAGLSPHGLPRLQEVTTGPAPNATVPDMALQLMHQACQNTEGLAQQPANAPIDAEQAGNWLAFRLTANRQTVGALALAVQYVPATSIGYHRLLEQQPILPILLQAMTGVLQGVRCHQLEADHLALKQALVQQENGLVVQHHPQAKAPTLHGDPERWLGQATPPTAQHLHNALLGRAHPHDRPALNLVLQQAGTHTPTTHLWRHTTADGHQRWVRGRFFPRKSQTNGHYTQDITLEDVTELRDTPGNLLAERDLFQAYYHLMPAGLATGNAQGIIEACNPRFASLLGYEVHELVGRSWADLTEPDSLQDDLKLFEELKAGKRKSYTLEKNYVTRAGHLLPAIIHVRGVYDPHTGELLRTAGIMELAHALPNTNVSTASPYPSNQPDQHDLTTLQTQLETALANNARLAENASRLRDVQRIANMGDYVIDMAKGTFVGWGDLYLRVGVRPLEEHPVSDILYRIHPDDLEPMRRSIQAELAVGRTFCVDFRLRVEEPAEWRWVRNWGEVRFDSQGKATQVYGLYQDVTKRRAQKEQVASSEARLRAMVERSPNLVALIDPNGQLEMCNQRFEQFYANILPRTPRPGDHVVEFAPTHAHKALFESVKDTVQRGHTLSYCWYAAMPNKPNTTLEVNWYPMPRPNGQMGMMLLCRYISRERQRFQQLVQSEVTIRSLIESTSDLISLMDHEGKVVFCNEAFSSISIAIAGKPLLPGMSFLEVVPPHDHADWQQLFARALAGEDVHYCRYLTQEDGSAWAHDIRLMPTNLPGAPRAVLVVAREITTEVEHLKQVRQSEAALISMIEAVPDAMLLMDRDGHVVRANAQFSNMVRAAKGVALQRGQNVVDCILEEPETAHEWQQHQLPLLQQGQPSHYCRLQPQMDGSVLAIEMRYQPIYHGKRVGAILMTLRNLTTEREAKLRLERSEAALSAVLENTDQAIWSVDRQYRVLAVNQNLLDLTERTYGTRVQVGENALAQGPQAALDRWKGYYDRALAGEAFTETVQLPMRGATRYYQHRFSPLRDDSGMVQGVTVFSSDVTDLQTSQERLSLTLEATGLGIWDWRVDRDEIAVDPAWQQLHGQAHTDGVISRRDWVQYIHPEDRRQAFRVLENVFREGENRIYESEYRVMVAGGGMRWLQVTGKVVQRRANGYPLRCLGFVRDITESRIHIQRLRDYQTAIDSSIIVSITNRHGTILSVNDKFCEVTGYARREVIGRTHQLINAGIHGETFFEAMYHHLEKGELYRNEICNRKKDGTNFWVDMVIAPLRDAGGDVTHYMTFMTDITDRLEYARKLESSLHEKQALITEIHHRVKNNLSVMHALLGTQASMVTTPEAREPLMNAAERLRNMSLLHEQLYASDNLAEVDLTVFLGKLVDTFRKSMAFAGCELTIDLDVNLSNQPLMVAMPLAMISHELMSNGLKHAAAKRPSVRMRLSLRETEDRIELDYGDDGPGYPQAVLDGQMEGMGFYILETMLAQFKAQWRIQNRGGAVFHMAFDHRAFLARNAKQLALISRPPTPPPTA